MREQGTGREAARGTAVQREHVERERRSMSGGRDETVEQKRGNNCKREKNEWR